ncbi:MAG: class I SAM-dependent methyltransferase [Tissierellales bacterium]|nr:class I SAM-dependent methyltransferase [Tissierellales bacterium]
MSKYFNLDSSIRNITMARSISTAKNYHNWVFSLISKYLNTKGVTLEIGAGHGEYTKMLLNVSKKVIATDIDQEAITKIRNKFHQIKNVEVLLMNGIDINKISEPPDNIVAINIIEHIKDDKGFVRDCLLTLRPSGILVIFAPAFQFLFSNIDREAGHFRRYSKNGLKLLLTNSGFKVVLAHYFNFIGFGGWMINKYLRSGVDSRSTNFQVNIFNKYLWLFRTLDVLFSPFCGQSVLVVGEKRADCSEEE